MAAGMVQVLKAADAVARWHVHQRRKGAAQEPYLNHLLEVAALVAEATAGSDVELILAALLHDAIEDQEVPRELIAETWGETVARTVEELTDDKSVPKAERKRRQIESSAGKSERAKLIKIADKTSNLRAVAASAAPDWSVSRRLVYVAWAREVVERLGNVNPWLEAQFAEAAALAERSVRP